MNLDKRMRDAMEELLELGWTERGIATAAGITHSAFRGWLRNRPNSNLTTGTYEKLLALVGGKVTAFKLPRPRQHQAS